MEVQNSHLSKNKQRKRNKRKNRNGNNHKKNHPQNNFPGHSQNSSKFQNSSGNKVKLISNVFQTSPSVIHTNGGSSSLEGASTETELGHLIEMFGSQIEHDIIRMCFESSNNNYEETILALTCMASQKDEEKPPPEVPKQEEKKVEETKDEKLVLLKVFSHLYRKSKLGLNSTGRTFVPGKGLIVKEEPKKEPKEEVKQPTEDEEEETGDPGMDSDKGDSHDIGATRTNNPFMDAFNNFSYQEPSEEELKDSKKIADLYMEKQEKEESEWFIEQEKKLLQQLIDDCQLDEYLGGNLAKNIDIEGVLDSETLKMIYDTSDSSLNTSATSSSSVEETKQDFPIIETKKSKGRRNRKKKTPEKKPIELPVNNEKPFDESNSTVFFNNSIVSGEAIDFANDPSLQYLINQQIIAEQEEKLLHEYQYDQSEFPSLVKGDALKQINRKKAFAVNDWTKTKRIHGAMQ